jgi:hypothetical protein
MAFITQKRRFRISRIGCFALIVLGLVLFSLLIYYINSVYFYDFRPQEKVLKEDLIGTWKLKPLINFSTPFYFFKKPSFIILRSDGCYEIHNPPEYLKLKYLKPEEYLKAVPEKYHKEYRDPVPKIYLSSLCQQVICGTWNFSDYGNPGIGFNGIFNFGHRIQGKSSPYQLWYCEIDPDVTPLYRWERISKDTKCPYCQCNIFIDTGRTHVEHTEFGKDRE